MKKIILLSLSLLMALGTIQPAFGMDDEDQVRHNPEEYRKAKKMAKRAGYKAGLGTGVLWGLGVTAAGLGIKKFMSGNKSDINGAVEIFGLTGLAFASGFLFEKLQKSAYAKIQDNQNLTPNDQKKLKGKFKSSYRSSNTITAAAAVTTSVVGILNKGNNISSLPYEFCATFPVVLTGVAAWNWLTYCRPTSKKSDQPARRDNNL